jgi:hypothetical protein
LRPLGDGASLFAANQNAGVYCRAFRNHNHRSSLACIDLIAEYVTLQPCIMVGFAHTLEETAGSPIDAAETLETDPQSWAALRSHQ